MKVIVAQHGNRHRYEIARILDEKGLLAALYTDGTSHSPMGHLAGLLARFIKSPILRRWTERRCDGIASKKVRSSDVGLLYDLLRRLRIIGERTKCRRMHTALAGRMIKWGVDDATAVYAMYDEAHDFLKFASSRGLKIYLDVFINPVAGRAVLADSGVSPSSLEWKRELEEEAYFKRNLQRADVVVCPSQYVVEGVLSLCPEVREKIRVSPYGTSLKSGRPVKPEPGRLLFVGREVHRKGVPYLAKAILRLKQSGVNVRCRVAGLTQEQVAGLDGGDSLECLGSLNQDQLAEEYSLADIFVLPSLGEGQPIAAIDALNYGLPVVLTRECGIDFSEDGPGLVVPSRDATLLAGAIGSIIGDRSQRAMMSERAVVFARRFSREAWAERLEQLLVNH